MTKILALLLLLLQLIFLTTFAKELETISYETDGFRFKPFVPSKPAPVKPFIPSKPAPIKPGPFRPNPISIDVPVVMPIPGTPNPITPVVVTPPAPVTLSPIVPLVPATPAPVEPTVPIESHVPVLLAPVEPPIESSAPITVAPIEPPVIPTYPPLGVAAPSYSPLPLRPAYISRRLMAVHF